VVAERDHVGARREQLLRELRREADAVGDVLSVQDAEVDAELRAERPEAVLDRAPAGNADDVSDEEEDQGSESAAAG